MAGRERERERENLLREPTITYDREQEWRRGEGMEKEWREGGEG